MLTSIDDVAARLSVGRSTVYALLKAQKLDAVKIGRRNLITEASLHRFVSGGGANGPA